MEITVTEVKDILKPENVKLVLTFPDKIDLRLSKDVLIVSKKVLGNLENAINKAVEIGCNIISETKYKWYFKKCANFEETLTKFFHNYTINTKTWNKCYLLSLNYN
jgi:hypothetical protein